MNSSNEAQKASQKDFEKVRKIFSYQDDLQRAFGRDWKRFKETLEIMECDIENNNEGKNPPSSKEDREKVESSVNRFMSFVFRKKLTPIFKDLSIYYLRIVFNWNRMVYKDKRTESKIKFVTEIAQEKPSIDTTLTYFKEVVKQAKNNTNKETNGLEFNRSYLRNIEEEINNS